MSKRVCTAEFIRRAREKHGDRYDYSKTRYVAAKLPVTITCPEHGEFLQKPHNHYIGHGCPSCGGNKKLNLCDFKSRAAKCHENKYDYSKVILENVESSVEIICPVHGTFFQRAATHLKGIGCRKCGWSKTARKLGHSKKKFLEDARNAHGDRYNYSEVKYINALTKVRIRCPEHGLFIQLPSAHVRGIGCPACGTESAADKRRKTTEEFVAEARKVHGSTYDYSLVDYKSAVIKVEIVCPEHGSFWQAPINHTKARSGCPSCFGSGFDPTKPGTLYYLSVRTDEGRTLYKIGITNQTVERRFSGKDLKRIRTLKTWKFSNGREAANRETDILLRFSKDRYTGPDVLVSKGNTELFNEDVLKLERGHPERRNPIVDRRARIRSRAVQLEFDFSRIQPPKCT